MDIESSPASLGTLLTAIVSGESGSVRFLMKSSDIQWTIGDDEDLYDTGGVVVGLYRLFTNFLKFPGESPGLGESIWGWGGGRGCPWDHRTFSLLSFIFHTSFN